MSINEVAALTVGTLYGAFYYDELSRIGETIGRCIGGIIISTIFAPFNHGD